MHTQNPPISPAQTHSDLGAKIRAYFALTKPRVMELLLVVTIPAMILAQNGLPNFWLVFATLLGGAMSAGSAGAFNCYIDRDSDKIMKRTKNRPLAQGAVSEKGALVFAWTLGICSILWLWATTNLLAALLSLCAIFFYVVVYTIILKRHSEQNIIWGGIAGCFPVLIGWAAVQNNLDWPAWIFFAIIFLWTPAHYWPLSMKYRHDYAAAGIPMLGVVRGRITVGLQIILYTWATVMCSLLLIPVGHLGFVYSVVALLSGAYFIVEAHLLYHHAVHGREGKPMRVFHGSISYLTVLSLAMSIDPLLPF